MKTPKEAVQAAKEEIAAATKGEKEKGKEKMEEIKTIDEGKSEE